MVSGRLGLDWLVLLEMRDLALQARDSVYLVRLILMDQTFKGLPQWMDFNMESHQQEIMC